MSGTWEHEKGKNNNVWVWGRHERVHVNDVGGY
jgi:hypothetical protein